MARFSLKNGAIHVFFCLEKMKNDSSFAKNEKDFLKVENPFFPTALMRQTTFFTVLID